MLDSCLMQMHCSLGDHSSGASAMAEAVQALKAAAQGFFAQNAVACALRCWLAVCNGSGELPPAKAARNRLQASLLGWDLASPTALRPAADGALMGRAVRAAALGARQRAHNGEGAARGGWEPLLQAPTSCAASRRPAATQLCAACQPCPGQGPLSAQVRAAAVPGGLRLP